MPPALWMTPSNPTVWQKCTEVFMPLLPNDATDSSLRQSNYSIHCSPQTHTWTNPSNIHNPLHTCSLNSHHYLMNYIKHAETMITCFYGIVFTLSPAFSCNRDGYRLHCKKWHLSKLKDLEYRLNNIVFLLISSLKKACCIGR